jgi:hypothetical protein
MEEMKSEKASAAEVTSPGGMTSGQYDEGEEDEDEEDSLENIDLENADPQTLARHRAMLIQKRRQLVRLRPFSLFSARL